MSHTKRQFVEEAFDELGLAGYMFDIQPAQLQSAVRKLDSMVATWYGKGIKLGYPSVSSPENVDLDTETGVPDWANEAISKSLAVRLAPSYGKVAGVDTKKDAKDAYQGLLQKAAMPQEMQITDLPRGAGSKSWRTTGSVFLDDANTDPLQIGEGGELEFLGD